MNPNNKHNFADNNHNYSSKTNHPIDEPIDAEIIAETPNNSSAVDEDENIINLTYHPVLEQNQVNQLQKDDSLSSWVEQGLTPLSTPWGLGSLSLILLSNLAITGVQLWKLYEPLQTSPTATLEVDGTASSLSIPNSLNIARKSPNKVILDGLSTVSNPSTPSQSPKQPKPSPIASAPTQKVVNVNQPLSLTNAILPPSLQPQTPQQSVTPLKVPQPPKNLPIPVAKIPRPLPSSLQPPPPPIPNQLVSQDQQVRQMMQQQLQPGMSPSFPPSPQPSTVPSMTIQSPPPIPNQLVSQDQQVRQTMQQQLQPGMSPLVPPSPQPSTVPSMTIQPPSPPINKQSGSQNEQVRQTIKQQLKMEENNQSNIPLGFNHKTRLEMQNGLNELPSQLLPQQVNYLEQLQQREVLDSQTSPGTNIK